jgi:2'-5' RNA ligase
MLIKNYGQFINESSEYQWGCVMVDVPVSNWKEVTSSIKPEHVYDKGNHGIQDDPHCTILYGFHDEVTPEQIQEVINTCKGNINIEIDGIDLFENDDYDVVKFHILPDPGLQEMFDKLSSLKNSNRFPEYKPHITIAYVKKGTGDNYINPNYKYKVKNVDNIIYSTTDGKKYKITLQKDN